jgi:indolepyruvate ferredoxin oxidoreductase beta subunit
MGSKRSMNIVMLGAAAPFLDMPYESFENGLRDIFGRKGDDVVNSNLAALKAGYDFSVKNRK